MNRHSAGALPRPLAGAPAPSEASQLIKLFNAGHFPEVEALARRLVARSPDSGFAWKALGASLQAQGKDTLTALQRIVELFPHDIQAYANLWLVLQERGLVSEAMASYRQALVANPGFAEAHSNLGNLLSEFGELDEAVNCFRRALAIKPGYAQAHNNLGKVLRDLGRLDEALASCRQALAIAPNFAEAHSNLGNALSDLRQLKEAAACYRQALAINPAFVEAHCNLGKVHNDLGQLDEAQASYRQALVMNPDFAQAHSGLLFCLSHSEAMSPQALLEEHCRFAQKFEAPLVHAWPRHANTRDPERPLKLGFVSGDLRNHAVAHFVEPVLAELAQHPGFSLHAYSTHPSIEDEITRRIQKHFSHWNSIAFMSDCGLAEKILSDGIDILVDLSGHTAYNRLLAFARKPAPIQISWIGYPNTTGLRAMDYVFGDRFNCPPGLHEPYYVEKFARIPSTGTFVPQFDAPAVNELPALSRNHVTFGSFNRPDKLQPQVISAWAQVMRAVPGSVMFLGNVSDASLAQRLSAQFGQHGIASDRLQFQCRLPLYDYLGLHHQVDILLDTWPYNGGTTTNFAIWMGVPVVTLVGPLRSHCLSAAVLGRSGLEGFTAHDVAGFIRTAVQWANSPQELARLRAGMRERIEKAPLRQPGIVAQGMAQAFRFMWKRWCAGLPADHFDLTRAERSELPEGESA